MFKGHTKKGSLCYGLLGAVSLFLGTVFWCPNFTYATSYSASLSTSGNVELNLTPSINGDSTAIGSDTLTATTTCPFGYKLSIQSSASDSSLYLDGDDANNTTDDTVISPVEGANVLGTNTWGYSTTSDSASGVFKGLTSEPISLGDGTKISAFDNTELYDDVATPNDGTAIPIYYGVRIANTTKPGAYHMINNGTIVYHMVMDGACINYTLSYDKNNEDATGTMNDQLVPVGNETALTANNFTREGYTFKEWNTEPDGTGDSFADEEPVTDITDPNTTLNLFAIWEANTYNITIKTVAGISSVTIAHGADTVCTTDNTTGTNCELTYDEDYIVTAVLSTGYTFNNWVNSENIGTIDDDTATTITYSPGLGDTELIPDTSPISYPQTTEVRYENADGTWGNYTTVDTKSVDYDSTYSWSTSELSGFDSTVYQSASVANYTVTGAHTNQISIYRKTFTVTKQYRAQNTSGDYPSSYTPDGSVSVRYGGSYTYSIPATTTHQAASGSASNVTANTTISVNVPRKTYTCTRQYRLQGADGNYPSSYTGDGSVTAYHGGSCSYTKSYTDYTSQTASASNVTSNQTLSVSLPRTTYNLTINRNTTYISSVSGAGTYRWGQSVSISATPASNFNGWSQTAGTTGSFGSTSSASTTFTMPKSAATIYADGKAIQSSCPSSPMLSTVASGITYMQNINSSNSASVLSKLAVGSTYQIKDNRDNETYCVGKLADGKLWLLDNLALDLVTYKGNLNSSNTNASDEVLAYLKNGGGSVQYPANGVIAKTSNSGSWTDSYTDPYIATGYISTVPQGNNDPLKAETSNGNWKIGVYYNYCAASAGSYCYSTSNASTDSQNGVRNIDADICPKGWHMPTGNTSGEYSALANAIYGSTGYTSDATAIANYRSALRLPLSGYFNNGSAGYQGSGGNWWSSTRSDNGSMYGLYASTSEVITVVLDDRNLGFSVRCVLGS